MTTNEHGDVKNETKSLKPDWYGEISMGNPSLQTPMMKQFIGVKKKVPDALLLFRMGDFYELFLQDALTAARVLEINVTSRNKKDKEPVPMAGIPFHALEAYLPRLVSAGFKVAIAEQEGDPKSGKMLERVLTRVVTPGVPWDTDGVEAKESCWLVAVCGIGPVGVASLDVSTGEFQVTQLNTITQAIAEIQRLGAKELILSQKFAAQEEVNPYLDIYPHSIEDNSFFDLRHAKTILCNQLKVATLSGFGIDKMHYSVSAAGALLCYVRDVTLNDLSHINRIQKYNIASQMVLDEATKTNLEILQPIRGTNRKGTLLHLLDKTATAMGGRLLRKWLAAPLVDIVRIRRRQDAVQTLLDEELRTTIQEYLRQVYDLERLSTKLGQQKISPRELLSLARSVDTLPSIFALLQDKPAFQGFIPQNIPVEWAHKIIDTFVEDPPSVSSEGGIIRTGINTDLDQYKLLSTQAKTAIAAMEEAQRKATDIQSLKIKYNRVFGYFFEVTSANKDKVPEKWIRKQTLSNSERFITPELKEFEEKILSSGEKAKALEQALFFEIRDESFKKIVLFQDLAQRIAYIDVFASLAEVAVFNRYCRPEVDVSIDIQIKAGRHPVIETMDMDEPFVPNDIFMDANNRQILLTGPNMSGKSTIMRQVALIVLMTQIGSFVPANSAKIGLMDTLFVRVGASDDLAQGRSTFMVEMSETAFILNQATERSLLMLDEIGRGTSTYDGMSIAWAVCEAIHDKIKARCIFATHYHELTELSTRCASLRNMHVAISDGSDGIRFLRTLQEGSVGKSYGIQCARLAGMPRSVIRRASGLLEELEKKAALKATKDQNQLSLFHQPRTVEVEVVPEKYQKIMASLKTTNLNECTPIQALNLLFELQKKLE